MRIEITPPNGYDAKYTTAKYAMAKYTTAGYTMAGNTMDGGLLVQGGRRRPGARQVAEGARQQIA